MSRVGKRILIIPEGVTVEQGKNEISVKGPKGELKFNYNNKVKVVIKENEITTTTKKETKSEREIIGTTNSLIENMLEGVTKGYEKSLETVGVGYKFNVQGNKLVVYAGYSNPVDVEIPNGLTVEQVNNTEIKISGIDKQLVGEFTANVRKIRKPEPYKGKGIRYKGEIVRRKEGKKAA